MRKTAIVLAILAGFASPSLAGGKNYVHGYNTFGYTVIVSCFRGPWKEVIWDRPEPVFIDSLVAAGYDYPTASAMAERICRDRSLVGDREALRGTAQGVVNGYPPSARYVAPEPVYRQPAPVYGNRAPIMHSTPGGGRYYYYGQ